MCNSVGLGSCASKPTSIRPLDKDVPAIKQPYHEAAIITQLSASLERRLGLKEQILTVLERSRFAVLATQRAGQPHASLMAFTPVSGLRCLVFATYRSTLKYRSLSADPRVALLIGDQEGETTGSARRLILTACGEAIEIPEAERQPTVCAHLARHPDLDEFLRSPDCALVRVTVGAYEVVGGIDDVQWYHVSV
jgi:nitroimidazol reductase NimA-like FMN-containing flavoprotein (pyridoxamine 5'-phosphate oxidase superfamily)